MRHVDIDGVGLCGAHLFWNESDVYLGRVPRSGVSPLHCRHDASAAGIYAIYDGDAVGCVRDVESECCARCRIFYNVRGL